MAPMSMAVSVSTSFMDTLCNFLEIPWFCINQLRKPCWVYLHIFRLPLPSSGHDAIVTLLKHYKRPQDESPCNEYSQPGGGMVWEITLFSNCRVWSNDHWSHRTTEWLGWEGPWEIIQSNPLLKLTWSRLYSITSSGFISREGGSSASLGSPSQCSCHSQNKEVFPPVPMKLPVSQFVPVAGHHWKEWPHPFDTHPCMHLWDLHQSFLLQAQLSLYKIYIYMSL